MAETSTPAPPKGGSGQDSTKSSETELNVAKGTSLTMSGVDPATLETDSDVIDIDSRNVALLAPLNVDPAEQYFEKDLDPNRRLTPQASVYLDHLERERAEVARAAVEGREPDLGNPPPSSGSPLRRADSIHNPNNQNVSVNMLSQKAYGVAESTETGVEKSDGQNVQDVNPQSLDAIGHKSSDNVDDDGNVIDGGTPADTTKVDVVSVPDKASKSSRK